MRRSRPQLVTAAVTAGAVALGVLAFAGSSHAASTDYSPAVSTPVADPYYPGKGSTLVDALHYDLHLRWTPESRRLHGRADILLRVTRDSSRLRLDLSKRLRVWRVRLDGNPTGWSQPPGNKLVVSTPQLGADTRHTLTVVYRGRPGPAAAPTKRRDIPSVGWTNTRGGGMWTMQEPFGAFTWYPVNDHPSDKAYYDVSVDVPSRMVGVSNGTLLSRKTRSGRTVTRWRMTDPAASYLVTLAIGDYVAVRDRGPHRLPLTYWVPRNKQQFVSTLRRSPGILRWLERRLGRYPFDRGGVVVVPSDSAMETQSLVTMGSRRMKDRQEAMSVLAHEYAHQWYGDTVTPDNWQDLWLNESFAMYVEIQYRIAKGWESERSWRRDLEWYDNNYRAHDGPPGAYQANDFGNGCVYYCGALMLFELGDAVGRDQLATALRAWPQTHQNSNVDRADYVDWFNSRTGTDLTSFFADWLTSKTTPPT